jgi:hypothetical protein
MLAKAKARAAAAAEAAKAKAAEIDEKHGISEKAGAAKVRPTGIADDSLNVMRSPR